MVAGGGRGGGGAGTRRAAAATATRNVYAGVRAEEIAELAAEIGKAKSRADYAQSQLERTAYLARNDSMPRSRPRSAENDAATGRADVAEAQANHAAAVAGPTNEERAIADAQVRAAAAAVAVLERQLDKTICGPRPTAWSASSWPRSARTSAPASRCSRSRRGQTMAVVQRARGYLARPHRGDDGRRPDAGTERATPALVTEILPLGPFATWQAERAVGDHDRNTLRLRLDPQRDATAFEPGMTVWIGR